MLRNARLAKLFQEQEKREEEEPDYGDYEAPPDYDLESIGGIEGLQDALRIVHGRIGFKFESSHSVK